MHTPYETLKETALFAGLSWEQARVLVDGSTMHRLADGEVVIEAGTKGADSMWVILEGGGEVLVGGHVVATYEGGDYFGELVVLSDVDVPRSADVVARGATIAMEISRGQLKELLAQQPEFAWVMLGELATRLRNTTGLLAEMPEWKSGEAEVHPAVDHLGPIDRLAAVGGDDEGS